MGPRRVLLRVLFGRIVRHVHGPHETATGTVGEILTRLARLDAERLALLEQLRKAGFRSRGFVGEYGELLAAAYYREATRARPSEPGFDLIVPGVGRVQVKTLRSTPGNYRTNMGVMRDPYDALLALRLDSDYRPTGAWEIPRATLERVYRHGARTSLTARLLAEPEVVTVPLEELEWAARALSDGKLVAREAPKSAHAAEVVVVEDAAMHRSTFTRREADAIRADLRALRRADRDSQRRIRRGLRERGFYISDYSSSSDGFTEADFEALVKLGTIRVG